MLNRLEQDDAADLRELRAVETLRDVWAVHYERGLSDHMRWTENTTRGGTEIGETPHDADAHWATKRGQDWVGYKLQITETDDDGQSHLITDIAVTPARQYDGSALPAIRERQQQRDGRKGYVYPGHTTSLDETTIVLSRWFVERCSIDDLQAQFSWMPREPL